MPLSDAQIQLAVITTVLLLAWAVTAWLQIRRHSAQQLEVAEARRQIEQQRELCQQLQLEAHQQHSERAALEVRLEHLQHGAGRQRFGERAHHHGPRRRGCGATSARPASLLSDSRWSALAVCS